MVADKNDTALGLGERLRSARKARALTLEQAAFTLRIEAPVLRALEDERYAALGAAVFVRGHLKAYAKLLGLSEEAVLAAYRAADPNADVPPKVTRELEKPLTTAPGPLAIAVVGAALLVMLLMFFFSSGGRSGPDTPVPLPLETNPADEPAAPADGVLVPLPLPATPDAGAVPPATDPPAQDPVSATGVVPAAVPAIPAGSPLAEGPPAGPAAAPSSAAPTTSPTPAPAGTFE